MDLFKSCSTQVAALAVLVFTLAPLTSAAQDLNRHGEVIAADGQEIAVRLSEGLSVSSGTAGTIYTTTTVGGEEQVVRVARVEVTGVEGREASCQITQQTQAPEAGFAVSFETVRRQGTLVVETEPSGAVVTVDGEEVGSGAVRQQLAPGEHVVEASAEGYESARRVLSVEAGQTREIAFDLQRAAGRLVVEATPDSAQVQIGQREVGRGDISAELPPGQYGLEVRAKSYVPYDTTVTVQPGKRTELIATLARKSGQVLVATDPDSARVMIDAQSEGRAPVITEVSRGAHSVRAEAEGYEPSTDSFSVGAEPTRVLLDLSRKQQLETVRVSSPSSTLVAGESLQVSVQGRTEDGRRVTSPNVSLSVSPSPIASVSADGKVRVEPDAPADEVRVTAEASTGAMDAALIHVKPAVRSLDVRPSKAQLRVGDSLDASVVATFQDGSKEREPNVSWTTSRPAVASVSEGTIRGRSAGETTIEASFRDKSVEMQVQVRRPVAEVRVQPDALTLLKGTGYTFQATALDPSGRKLNRDMQWAVRNPSVATVSENGTIKAREKGKTIVVVNTDEVSAEIPIQVEGPGVSAGGAFFSGLLLPGLGNYRTGQVGFGVMVTLSVGGAAAAGLLSERTTEYCTTQASDECPPGSTLDTETKKHLLVPGLAAAGGAMLLGAIVAAAGAGKDDLPRPSVAVEISDGVKAPLALEVGKSNLGVTFLSVDLEEALSGQ